MALGKYSCNHNMSESKMFVSPSALSRPFDVSTVALFLPFFIIKLVEHGNIQEHDLRDMSSCSL